MRRELVRVGESGRGMKSSWAGQVSQRLVGGVIDNVIRITSH